MFGDALLVAPLVEGESEREVLLPSGIWYGLETGERYTRWMHHSRSSRLGANSGIC